jgi:hypothetical protein
MGSIYELGRGLKDGTTKVFVSGKDSGVIGIETEVMELEQVEEESYCGGVFIKTMRDMSV